MFSHQKCIFKVILMSCDKQNLTSMLLNLFNSLRKRDKIIGHLHFISSPTHLINSIKHDYSCISDMVATFNETVSSIRYCKFGNFCENFNYANSIKRHICDVKNSRLGHDLPSSVNYRMITLFHEGLFSQTWHMPSFAKIKPSKCKVL